MGCISLLQLPRTLIKFWQVYIKHFFVTYEQSGKDLNDISQPEPFEVGPMSFIVCFADYSSMVSIISGHILPGTGTDQKQLISPTW